jgi:hypothetical protein
MPAPEVASRTLSAGLVRVERLLLMIGWSIKDLDVDTTTGTGRAEFRSADGRRVVIVADDRATVIERYQEREVIKTWRDDPLQAAPSQRMGPSVEVSHVFMGRSKVPSFVVAIRDATIYMVDNMPSKALQGEANGKLRRFISGQLESAVCRVAKSKPPDPNVTSVQGEPLTAQWVAECENCCRGDGRDPYMPFVASRDRDVRWVAASGRIEGGRGINRDFSYAHARRGRRA